MYRRDIGENKEGEREREAEREREGMSGVEPAADLRDALYKTAFLNSEIYIYGESACVPARALCFRRVLYGLKVYLIGGRERERETRRMLGFSFLREARAGGSLDVH